MAYLSTTLPWRATRLSASLLARVPIISQLQHRISMSLHTSDESPTADMIRRVPYPSQAPDISVFETMTDEYITVDTGAPLKQLPTAADMLVKFVKEGDAGMDGNLAWVSNASKMLLDLQTSGMDVPRHPIFDKAARVSLKAIADPAERLTTHHRWFSLYMDAHEIAPKRRRFGGQVWVMLGSLDKPDVPLMFSFAMICARKGYARDVSSDIFDALARYSSPSAFATFLRDFCTESLEYGLRHDEPGADPFSPETYHQPSKYFEIAICSMCSAERPLEALKILCFARSLSVRVRAPAIDRLKHTIRERGGLDSRQMKALNKIIASAIGALEQSTSKSAKLTLLSSTTKQPIPDFVVASFRNIPRKSSDDIAMKRIQPKPWRAPRHISKLLSRGTSQLDGAKSSSEDVIATEHSPPSESPIDRMVETAAVPVPGGQRCVNVVTFDGLKVGLDEEVAEMRQRIFSGEGPTIPEVAKLLYAKYAAGHRKSVGTLRKEILRSGERLSKWWIPAELYHYHEAKQWKMFFLTFERNFHLDGVPRARFQDICRQYLNGGRVYRGSLHNRKLKMWPSHAHTVLVWSAMARHCETVEETQALYSELLAQHDRYQAGCPLPLLEGLSRPDGITFSDQPLSLPSEVVTGVHFMPFLQRFGHFQRLDFMKKVVTDMHERGFELDSHHLNYLIAQFAKLKDVPNAMRLLSAMEEARDKYGSNSEVPHANLVTYETLINVLIRNKRWAVASNVAGRMKLAGYTPGERPTLDKKLRKIAFRDAYVQQREQEKFAQVGSSDVVGTRALV